MAYTESSISIKTIDNTLRSESTESELTVVAVVDVPSGTYEEKRIGSVTEFVNEYLTGSDVVATDSETAKNVCKLLQTMPVHCIRAANPNVKSGINNLGEIIYTDMNNVPYEFSHTFTLDVDEGAGLFGWLQFKNALGSGQGATVLLDQSLYTSDVTSYGTNFELKEVLGEIPTGIDVVCENMVANTVFNQLQNIGVDLSNDQYYTVYTLDGVSLYAYPEWVDTVDVTNLESTTKMVTFEDTGYVTTGEYICINGNSFYFALEGDEEVTNNIPGSNAVEVLGSSSVLTGKDFGVMVFDKIITENYTKPIYSEFRMDLLATGAFTTPVLAGSADFVDALVVSSDNTIQPYSTGAKVISEGSRLIVSNNGYVGVTDAIVIDNETIAANNGSVEITGNVDLYKGTTVTVVTDTKKTFSGGFDLSGNCTVVTDSKTVQFSIDSEGKFNVVDYDSGDEFTYSFTYTPFTEDNSTQYYVFYAGANYPVLNCANVFTYSISDGDVTCANAVLNMYLRLYAAGVTGVTLTYGNVRFVTSDSTVKTLLTNSDNLTITAGVSGMRRYSISRDSTNFQTILNSYAVKIGYNVFYCGDYTKQSNFETLIQLDPDKITYSEFIDDLFAVLPSYYACTSDTAGTKFTLFNNTGNGYDVAQVVNGESKVLDGVQYNYTSELDARFAVIANYATDQDIFSIQLLKDGSWYQMTLMKKDSSNSYDASFVDGTYNGYGINIYFTAINAKQDFCTLIDLNTSASVFEIDPALTFGGEISLPTPSLGTYKAAANRTLLETGQQYDFFWTAGYDVADYVNHLATIGTELYCQVIASIPSGVLDVASAVDYRNTTKVDNYQVHFSMPYYHDSSLGTFDTLISPGQAVLEKYYANMAGQKSFAPLFWKTNGRLNISTTMSAASGLLVHFDNVEDRNALLSSQINVLKIDKAKGLVYINDQLTAQTIDSDLSEFNNVRMVNKCAHLCDSVLDNFIAMFNDQATRMLVTTQLTSVIQENMFSTEQFKPSAISIVCDETNNTPTIISNRQLVVDVYMYFTGVIKRIQVYQYVMPLES